MYDGSMKTRVHHKPSQQGVYSVEYTVLLALVAVSGALAIATASHSLFGYYLRLQTVVFSPIP